MSQNAKLTALADRLERDGDEHGVAAELRALAADPAESTKNLWKARYFDRRDVISRWHAKAVELGYDGVADLLDAVEKGEPPLHIAEVLARAANAATAAPTSNASEIAEVSIDQLIPLLGTEDPFFSAWRDRVPDKHWVKLDLSALRVGYELGKRLALRPRTAGPVAGVWPSAWIVANADETLFRCWGNSGPEWIGDRDKALQFARHQDADAFSADDEEAWKIIPARATPVGRGDMP